MKQHLRFLPALLACGAMAFGVTALAATGSARIDSVRAGSARYSTDGASWVDAKAGAELAPGTVIRTDSLGVVDLYLGKNGPYVRVTPDSEMTLKTLDIQGGAGETIVTTELGLRTGKLQGEVRKMSAASRYEIMTPVGTVGVRGTKYQVSARGECSFEDGPGYINYVAPGATAPTDFVVRPGYTFEPSLNSNRGGVIETLPSVSEEIAVATRQFGGGAVVAGEAPAGSLYAPVPSWAAFARPFAAPSEGDPITQPFGLPPVYSPTTPFGPAPFEPPGDGDGDGDGEGGE